MNIQKLSYDSRSQNLLVKLYLSPNVAPDNPLRTMFNKYFHCKHFLWQTVIMKVWVVAWWTSSSFLLTLMVVFCTFSTMETTCHAHNSRDHSDLHELAWGNQRVGWWVLHLIKGV